MKKIGKISGFPGKEHAGKIGYAAALILAGVVWTTAAFANELPSLETASFGVMTGSTGEFYLEDTYPQADIQRFDNIADAVLALRSGKADYVLTAYTTALNYCRSNKDIYICERDVLDDSAAIALGKGNRELFVQVDAAIKEFQEDGTLDEVLSHWIREDGSAYEEIKVPEAEGGEYLTVGIAANREPMCFVQDNDYVGLDCELIERIAFKLGKKVRYSDMQFSALVAALESGKVDVVISNMTNTPERAEKVDFTRDYFDNPQVLLTRVSTAGQEEDHTGFFGGLRESFDKTFIREDRWRLIADGLGVTCLIAVLSAVAGSILGFGVCMLRMAKNRAAVLSARLFVRLVQGTPVLVILMLLYYVVFTGDLSLGSVTVAVIGFSVNFAAYVSEMMRTGIEAVDRGQIEAAQAMGYGRIQTFRKVTFPQAAMHFLPVYEGEVISLVKMTSVVGYIAIQDLTKAGDIIRSRTYEAFFPLITTAVIYFLLSWLLTRALACAENRIDPKRRKRSAEKKHERYCEL